MDKTDGTQQLEDPKHHVKFKPLYALRNGWKYHGIWTKDNYF
jgi:hypothetical protein